MLESPFHEGELLVQQQVGETIAAQQNGQIIADTIPKGAFKFITQQPMVIVGSLDAHHHPWASILFGQPGFIQPVDPRTVELDVTQTLAHSSDPLWTNIHQQPQVGMLVIELSSRRRLRINGTLAQANSANTQAIPAQLQVQVLESYPNCPKYIQRRHLALNIGETLSSLPEPRSGPFLTAEQQAWIAAADTLFVASAHPDRGVDVSHRGGNPGFVQILDDRTLRIPDYAGNSMFNTLGNLAINPQAGLVFLDFDRSRTLQLVGHTTLQWHLDPSRDTTGGTHRYWDFAIEHGLEMDLPQSLHWEFLDYSPHNPTDVG